jgi:hypothetical protein
MSLRRGFVFGARLNIALHVQRAQQLSTLGVISNFFPTSKLTKDDASRFPKTIADLVSQKLSETTKLPPETIDSMVVNEIEFGSEEVRRVKLKGGSEAKRQ